MAPDQGTDGLPLSATQSWPPLRNCLPPPVVSVFLQVAHPSLLQLCYPACSTITCYNYNNSNMLYNAFYSLVRVKWRIQINCTQIRLCKKENKLRD